jgi:hypothetical protein
VVEDRQPYKPSLIDRFNGWVAHLSIQSWIFYSLLGIALSLVQILFLWLEDGSGSEELLPVIIFNGLAPPIILWLFQFLDEQAVRALRIMRPVMDLTEPEWERHKYKIANMPLGFPLAAGLIATVMVILIETLASVPDRYLVLEQLPTFNVVFYAIDKLSAFLYGVFFYHTIRQLRLVNENLSHAQVNLFNLSPLQAFAPLTATTAIGLVIGFYGWMVINPELISDPVILGILVVITILALVVFGWPLYGVHQRMVEAKMRAMREIDNKFELLFSKFNAGFQEGDDAELIRINGIIAGLEAQHRRISTIPTWPWSPETARFALTAIALPLILTVLQFLVRQALGI